MKNQEIAKLLYRLADILEIEKVEWKPRAYRRAAQAIETLSYDVEDAYNKGGIKSLIEIPGVGRSIAEKIEEYLKSGKIKTLEKESKKIPAGLEQLLEVMGLGPKRIALLYQKLKIKNIKDLEKAAKEHRIAKLSGFGLKSEESILEAIGYRAQSSKRVLLSVALQVAERIKSEFKNLKEIKHFEVMGSLRRMKESIGDIDILVTTSKPKIVMEKFLSLSEVARVIAKGKTKTTVILNNGMQADIRVVPNECFGSALQYFTGNKEHNIMTRNIGIKKGLKLSEYGLFDRKTGKRVAVSEEEIYRKLGLKWMEPELRENRGEIEAARLGKLPKLVSVKDIKGDLHNHTNWSDGGNSIIEMVEAAKKNGYEYFAITDHSKTTAVANGLDERRLKEQYKEILKARSKVKGIKILWGSECDILGNGELDYPDDVLKKFDIVVAAVHSGFKMEEDKMTARVIKAIKNENVDILDHPTGRLIDRRPAYKINLEKVFKVAEETGTVFEVNSSPNRLDLNDVNVMAALKHGLKIAIDTDSHSTDQLNFIDLGVAQARRGWAEAKDVVNTLTFDKLKGVFKKIKV